MRRKRLPDNDLVEPYIMLPTQFFPNSSLQPEMRLLLAVLEDAVDTFKSYAFARDPWGRHFFREVEIWFKSKDRRWPFSFENICDALELDAGWIREKLYKWQERQRVTRHPIEIVFHW